MEIEDGRGDNTPRDLHNSSDDTKAEIIPSLKTS